MTWSRPKKPNQNGSAKISLIIWPFYIARDDDTTFYVESRSLREGLVIGGPILAGIFCHAYVRLKIPSRETRQILVHVQFLNIKSDYGTFYVKAWVDPNLKFCVI